MLTIIKAPNAALRVATKPVKKITAAHLRDIALMIKLTKTFVDPEGVGLASTQVGLKEQFFIAKLERSAGQNPTSVYTPVFNPKILFYSKRVKKYLEGCLSIPDYYGNVTRPSLIKVTYLNQEGRLVKETLTGVNATIFQHEYDHLHSKLFIDLILLQKSKLYKVTGKDQTGSDVFEEVVL